MTRCIEQLHRVKEADVDGSDDAINIAKLDPAMEGQEIQHRSWHDRLSELLAPDVRSPLLVLCCAYFMLGYYNSGLFYWLIEYFKYRGMELYISPAMMAGPCGKVAGVVLLVLGGPEICVIDRFRRVPLIQLGFFGAGALLLMIAATSSPILAVAALFISAIFEEMIWSVAGVYMTEIFPTTVRSAAPGVINFFLSVGAITSASSVGELLVIHPELPMLLMAIGMIAGGILMYFCEESFGEPLRDCSPHAAANAASYGACESSPEITGLPS